MIELERDRGGEVWVRSLAELHVSCLPESFVSRLGTAYAQHFYQFICKSPYEMIFAEWNNGVIASVLVMSYRPTTLLFRLAYGTPLTMSMLMRFWKLPLWPILRSKWQRRASRLEEPWAGLPEVILLFTGSEHRKKGFASHLLWKAAGDVQSRGLSSFIVKTQSDPNNAAISFYERIGLSLIGESDVLGSRYNVFMASVGLILSSVRD